MNLIIGTGNCFERKIFLGPLFIFLLLLGFSAGYGQSNSGEMTDEPLRAVLRAQIERYPLATCRDIYKLLFQSAFGCEHAITDSKQAREWLEKEIKSLQPGTDEPLMEKISPDGRLVRVNLRPFIAANLDIQLLFDSFVKTAQTYRGSKEQFIGFLRSAEKMCAEGQLPIPPAEMKAFFSEQAVAGFPPMHHSIRYKKAYNPAYRVILADLVPSFLPHSSIR